MTGDPHGSPFLSELDMADKIEVIYATQKRQFVHEVELQENDTFRSVIERSGLLKVFPELDPDTMNIGSFGRSRKIDDKPGKFDRVEVYRPITADPRSVRRK